MAILSRNTTVVKGAVGELMALTINVVAIIVGLIVVAFTAGGQAWKLALVICALLPCIVSANVVRTKMMQGSAGKQGKQYARANALASESVEHVRIVQSFTSEEYMNVRDIDSTDY